MPAVSETRIDGQLYHSKSTCRRCDGTSVTHHFEEHHSQHLTIAGNPTSDKGIGGVHDKLLVSKLFGVVQLDRKVSVLTDTCRNVNLLGSRPVPGVETLVARSAITHTQNQVTCTRHRSSFCNGVFILVIEDLLNTLVSGTLPGCGGDLPARYALRLQQDPVSDSRAGRALDACFLFCVSVFPHN